MRASGNGVRGWRFAALAASVGALAGLVALAVAPWRTQATEDPVQGLVGGAVGQVQKKVGSVVRSPERAVGETVAVPQKMERQANRKAVQPGGPQPVATNDQAKDPKTEPPAHGTNPHAQGTVAVADLNPRSSRPYEGDPSGEANGEDVVVGRTRADQNADGSYHGHITIAALFGNEILGVDTGPGETGGGPLDAVQKNVLDRVCDGSGNQICVAVLRADSSTTGSGSTNTFSTLRADIGGQDGIGAGVAESRSVIGHDDRCQVAAGTASAADVRAGGSAVARAAPSSSSSTACNDGTGSQTADSRVIELFGTGVPIPASGCADGTPDTVSGIPTLAPIVCNAQESSAGVLVREALSAFLLDSGLTSLLKLGVAATESRAVAPPEKLTPSDNPKPKTPPEGGPDEPGPEDEPDRPTVETEEEAGGPAAAPASPRLPFTGLPLLPIAAIGGAMLAGGAGLRRLRRG